MRFLLVSLIYAILFFSDIPMNFFEKILFGGIYVLCVVMEIVGIFINRKYPNNDKECVEKSKGRKK